VAMILIMHARENRRPVLTASLSSVLSACALVAMTALIALAAHENGARGLAAMNAGIRAFTVTEVTSSPAGAGRAHELRYRLRFRWHGFGAPRSSDTPAPRPGPSP
jgi:cellulose synthase (UDP-forming)